MEGRERRERRDDIIGNKLILVLTFFPILLLLHSLSLILASFIHLLPLLVSFVSLPLHPLSSSFRYANKLMEIRRREQELLTLTHSLHTRINSLKVHKHLPAIFFSLLFSLLFCSPLLLFFFSSLLLFSFSLSFFRLHS